MLNCEAAARLLMGWDGILVACHENPDGDALGSMAALVRGLRALGKRAMWLCADPVPERFAYLFEGMEEESFEPAHFMTVDVADQRLLGPAWERLEGKVELAIDHHGTHKPFAAERWVEPDSAATAEMVWLLLQEMGVPVDRAMADCVYTGISTDTGCFRYRNTTPRTHRIAAELLELGARGPWIDQMMHETKSRVQLEAERLVMADMEFQREGRIALIRVPQSVYKATGAAEGELEALSSLPRQVEGVVIGVIMKEKPDGTIKAGLRTNPPADASEICRRFGGGGHPGAAGCTMEGMDMEAACAAMKSACEDYLREMGL